MSLPKDCGKFQGCSGREAMERKVLVVSVSVGFLGILSAALGFAAEGKRIKVSGNCVNLADGRWPSSFPLHSFCAALLPFALRHLLAPCQRGCPVVGAIIVSVLLVWICGYLMNLWSSHPFLSFLFSALDVLPWVSDYVSWGKPFAQIPYRTVYLFLLWWSQWVISTATAFAWHGVSVDECIFFCSSLSASFGGAHSPASPSFPAN